MSVPLAHTAIHAVRSSAFEGQKLRGVKIDGEPWFVAADACRSLGLNMSNGSNNHTRKLSTDERLMVNRSEHPLLFKRSHASEMTLISRPGLFKLIQRSSKPEAVRFDRWVRHEVLPQIMDTGAYVAADAICFPHRRSSAVRPPSANPASGSPALVQA